MANEAESTADQRAIRLFCARHIPAAGVPYLLAVAEKLADVAFIAEGHVFWQRRDEETPVQSVRYNYPLKLLDWEIFGQPAVSVESAIRDMVHWADGAINAVVLEAYQRERPPWPYPDLKLRELEATELIGVWLTRAVTTDLQTIRTRTESPRLRQLLEKITSLRHIVEEE